MRGESTPTYSAFDRNIVALSAAWELIDSMVNYAHFPNYDNQYSSPLMFGSPEAQKLFLIILADFLSLPRDGTLGLTKPNNEGSLGTTYLGHLKQVAEDPQLAGDCVLLRSSVEAFSEWLDGYAVVEDVWLPSIERNGKLRVRRSEYLKICGNISKHGFTRLGGVVAQIRKILLDNGTDIDEGQGYQVIPEFQEWFQDNVFVASSTHIAWHLNEIRWGIYKYLQGEFQRSYTPTEVSSGAQMYKYDVPESIKSDLVKGIYWELMNDVRSQPYFSRFSIDKYWREVY